MPDQKTDDKQSSTVVGNIASLLGLYAIFVYLAGWTFFDYYYRTFGLYTRWVDISIPETLMKGFIILFEGARWLWAVYLFVLVVPMLFVAFPKFRDLAWLQVVAAVVMLFCLPLTYRIAKSVAVSTAQRSQTESTTELPYVRFATNCGTFSGRLLYIKDGAVYINDLQVDKSVSSKEKICLSPSEPKKDIHFLTKYRSEDINGLEILEH